MDINGDIVEGKWKQLKGMIKEEWGELTDDQIDQIEGRREKFAGVMQEHYGLSKEDADERFDKMVRRCN